MDPIADYLSAIKRALALQNATEHTHRPALKRLIESISLQHKHTATNEPTREACGAPDFSVSIDTKHGPLTIGYIEAKDVGKKLDDVLRTDQLRRYLKSLHSLILTNYLEFRWYVEGKPRSTARLAEPGRRGTLKVLKDGPRSVRALLEGFLAQSPEPVSDPEDLAERLAKLTHLIRDVIVQAFTTEKASPMLTDLRKAFADTLLPDIEKPEKTGEFADMYAQTLAYGLFAARCNHRGANPFIRQMAAAEIPKTNPFLRQIFNTITGPGMADEPYAGLVDDLVALLAKTRIDAVLANFGKRTRREDPVVHFYETFLGAYDPKLRKARGVYFTPEPVVSYIVRSVDWVLKEKFGLPAGLADTSTSAYQRDTGKNDPHGVRITEATHAPRVLILDPACGTGTFLYAVIDHIRERFMHADNAGTWSPYVREHLLPRLLGFELLMAPYAVAHLKLGMQLAGQDLPDGLRPKWAYDFAKDDRLGVYLTNTLEEAERKVDTLYGPFRAISDEANAASRIKRDLPIMVVLGNPPYSGHSANQGEWITGLIEAYKQIGGTRLRLGQAKWLQNDYAKFIRFAEDRILQTGHGVLGFITDHSYLTSGTFVGMRAHLAEIFDETYVLDLQGNEKLNKNRHDVDNNVFDITQGVSILIGIRSASPSSGKPIVRVKSIRGTRKKKYDLLRSESVETIKWESPRFAAPYYLLVSTKTSHLHEYEHYPSILDIIPGVRASARAKRVGTGFVTTHDEFAISFTPEEAVEKVQRFVGTRTERAARSIFRLCSQDQWNYSEAKAALRNRDLTSEVLPIQYRPFDTRRTIWNQHVCVHRRVEVHKHVLAGRLALLVGQAGSVIGSDEWSLAFVTRVPVDFNVFYRGGSAVLPAYVAGGADMGLERALFAEDGKPTPNVTSTFAESIESSTGMRLTPKPSGDLRRSFGVEDVIGYVYAILYSPSYRARYAAMLDIDYPRLPDSPNQDLFKKLTRLGLRLIAQHLLEAHQVADWGSFPIKGGSEVEARQPRYVRAGSPEPRTGNPLKRGRVYINKGDNPDGSAGQYFDNVPPEVWEYRIGGYQVCEKWLKDRRKAKYGRALSYADIEHYQKIVSAIAETIRIQGEIDEVIEAHGGWPIR